MGSSRVNHCGPEFKRQSVEWRHTNSRVKKRFWAQWSVKVMLSIF